MKFLHLRSPVPVCANDAASAQSAAQQAAMGGPLAICRAERDHAATVRSIVARQRSAALDTGADLGAQASLLVMRTPS